MPYKHLVIPLSLHILIKAKAAENHITMTQLLKDMFGGHNETVNH